MMFILVKFTFANKHSSKNNFAPQVFIKLLSTKYFEFYCDICNLDVNPHVKYATLHIVAIGQLMVIDIFKGCENLKWALFVSMHS